jgi:D-serine deaminase-like pyridoxal phosphate-dependent protein
VISETEALAKYRLSDEAKAAVPTPALVLFPELLYDNIGRAVKQVGRAERLRPHFKTHKTMEVVRFLQTFGVKKHKCATIAEAEVLARAGAKDVLLAYPLVGPNVERWSALRKAYPDVLFRTVVDHPDALEPLLASKGSDKPPLEILVDVNVGMDRTGACIDDSAAELYRRLHDDPRSTAAGLHVYDGHTNMASVEERRSLVDRVWAATAALVKRLEADGLAVPRIVVGGTGGFARWGELTAEEPRLECSPGTLFLNDWGYYSKYQDLDYFPSAAMLTRVVSKPKPGLLTFDLGSKSISPDSDAPKRAKFLGLPDAKILSQHEEHMVVETSAASSTPVGALFYAWPHHICPTVALHQEILIAEGGEIVDAWKVAARDRRVGV